MKSNILNYGLIKLKHTPNSEYQEFEKNLIQNKTYSIIKHLLNDNEKI